MQSGIRYAPFLMLLTALCGCGPKGAKLQKSVVPPDRTLFETGVEYLEKSQYIKARLALQTLITTYTDSELAAEAKLAMGDSFYKEGGTENLVQAEDQYKDFIIFFPTHPKAADAQLKIIALNMRMMRAPDRDQTYGRKAESAIKRFFDLFPDNEYIPSVKKYLVEVQENLAQGDFLVGQFYADKGNYLGAKSRFQEIVDKYPDFSATDGTYFLLAQSLEKTSSPDEAAAYYSRIATGYPFSKFFDESKARLQALGKPIPPVDTQLAAQNQARQKPSEGFSPLKPIIVFAEALGFKGPPDRYELAKKTVEAQKAEAAAALARAGTVEGQQLSDGILIQTELRKDASGKVQETTVLGSASGGGQQAGSKPAEKKNESGKNKGKNTKKQP